MKTVHQNERAFTLIEMMIVLAIIVILIAISWSGFFELRTTMRLHQASENLKSDLVYAQRSAMFIKRKDKDRWIRGIGVKLDGLDHDPMTYTIFKWCASDDGGNYEDFYAVAFGSIYEEDVSCSLIGDGEGLESLSGKEDVLVSNGGMTYVNSIDVGGSASYVVFEAVTGKPHFYNDTGDYFPLSGDYDVNMVFDIGGRQVGVVINNFGEIYKNVP
ncbi:MAG: prepilin-type N-terminal cleavage/methylation domain-containing protein [Patescibacteria group bacterium]|nr:prepilin-type N-terminal cleavage/methylation domain-containing protein [Patescibacteria group bacterium]